MSSLCVLYLVVRRSTDKQVFLQVGRQNLWVQKRYEQYDTIRSKLTLDLAQEYGEEMQAGVYEFAWSFIVPANAAVSKAAIDVRSRSLMPLSCC